MQLLSVKKNVHLQFYQHLFSRNYHYFVLVFFQRYFSSIVFSALGAGCVKSNLAVFGAEQHQVSKITSKYFDKYAMVVNIGSAIAIFIIPYVKDYIPVNYYYIPYLIATSMLFIAAILFLIGWKFYIHVTPYETVVAKCIPVIYNSIQSWYKYKQTRRLIDHRHINSSHSDLLNASHSLNLTDQQESIRHLEPPLAFIDYAKVPYGKFHDRIVDDVKSLRKACFVFTFLIPYWFIYNQVKKYD